MVDALDALGLDLAGEEGLVDRIIVRRVRPPERGPDGGRDVAGLRTGAVDAPRLGELALASDGRVDVANGLGGIVERGQGRSVGLIAGLGGHRRCGGGETRAEQLDRAQYWAAPASLMAPM